MSRRNKLVLFEYKVTTGIFSDDSVLQEELNLRSAVGWKVVHLTFYPGNQAVRIIYERQVSDEKV